jgi:hypothetical protein
VFATLINDAAPAEDGFSLVQVVTVFVAFAVVWPLLSRLRRALSERRRTRWSADEAETQTDDMARPRAE